MSDSSTLQRARQSTCRRSSAARRSTRIIDSARRITATWWVPIIFIVALILLAVSPLLLRALSNLPGMNWAELGDVSQTISAGTALLTALALTGVVVSLLFQAHDNKIAQQQTRRTFHHELIRLAMDDPLYMRALGGSWHLPLKGDQVRQHLYVHLWASFWHMLFDIGNLPEEHLRHILSTELFTGEAGRDYWSLLGEDWWSGRDRSGRSQRFCQIVDEEYRKALSGPPPAVPADPSEGAANPADTHTRPRIAPTGVALAALTAVGGLLIARKIRARQKPR